MRKHCCGYIRDSYRFIKYFSICAPKKTLSRKRNLLSREANFFRECSNIFCFPASISETLFFRLPTRETLSPMLSTNFLSNFCSIVYPITQIGFNFPLSVQQCCQKQPTVYKNHYLLSHFGWLLCWQFLQERYVNKVVQQLDVSGLPFESRQLNSLIVTPAEGQKPFF